MSLAGNLADLSLGDILQILNLSQKSGVLVLEYISSSIEILFVDGKLVSMVPNTARETVGEFLANNYNTSQRFDLIANVVDSSPQSSWNYLIQLYFQDPSIRPIDIAKEYMQWLMNKVYSTHTGTFHFSLDIIDRRLNELSTSGWVPLIKPGLNPQFLAMEAARVSDEERQEESESAPAVVTKETVDVAVALEEKKIVVVDDNPKILEAFLGTLQDADLQVAKMIRSVNGLQEWIDDQSGDLSDHLFLVDLVMPKRDRSGVLGGLDALKILRNRSPSVQALLMVDVESEQIEEKVAASGALGSVPKGTRRAFREDAEVSSADLLSAVRKALSSAKMPMDPSDSGESLTTQDPFSGLDMSLLASDAPAALPSNDPEVRSRTLMEGLLEELIDVDSAQEIVLLILRYASELLDRAVLLDVRGEFAYGRGQFGLAVREADELVRKIKMPLNVDSLFKAVIDGKQAYRGILPDSQVHRTFINIIGGSVVGECFVCPLLADRRVTAILYGDNLSSGAPLQGTQGAQLFLKQAGMAYETALLRERLREGEA